ncbi:MULTISPECIES: nucleoside deaminase [Olivibacter]|jgi:tRNA(Arg) A34 adenosine deaminase TadA|uniref:Guanine deaminase n=3 Tax=Sphingobacteriaceae TaxID=84566 RepID=F4C419_SPHS2|nr:MULTISPECIES: nucleoside deaminase [Olivibacter]MDM8175088.1 nucleoside deaminase [Olivibacter sp. 47]
MMASKDDIIFLKKAIDLAVTGVKQNKGGPFGCIIVKDGKIIGKGCNSVTSTIDPTAHAEIVAIRDACKHLGEYQLDDCTLYASCEPCPMCLGAIYWARPSRVVYAATRFVAAQAGFDDAFIYEEINLTGTERRIPFEFRQINESQAPFLSWEQKETKDLY